MPAPTWTVSKPESPTAGVGVVATVRVSVGLMIPLREAVIAVVPMARVEASPWLPAALEMVATEAVPDAQVTCVVRLAVVPSV